MTRIQGRDEGAALTGESDDFAAAVSFGALPDDEAPLLKAVYGGGHGGVGEEHLFADGRDGHGTFVQQDLKDHEVAETYAFGGDAGLDVGGQGAIGPGENDPEPWACGVGGRC